MEAPLLWFTNLRIWCNLRTKTTEHDFQSDYLIRIWNIRGYNKGQESRNLNIRYSFTQCNNICLLLYMICDIRFNNSTSETRHSDKCNLNHTDEPLLSFTFCEKRVNGFLFDVQGVIDALTDIFPVMTTKYLHGKNVRKYIFFMFITMLAHKKYIFHVNPIELLERQ